MKKFIVAGIAFLSIIVACHRKTIPASPDQAVQPAAPAQPVQPVAATATADLEAGKIIYETKCTRCHGMKAIENYTTDRWVGILRSMVPKARLDSVQTVQVTAYVNAHARKS
jgi:mono/diheme cytochrome c family protein